MNYHDFLVGIEQLTLEQKEVLFEYLKYELAKSKSSKKDVVATMDAEKISPVDKVVKEISNGFVEKPQSEINCCLHCGSVKIKKHGTTKGGVQRYICKDCGKTFSENYGLITHYTHLSEWQWQEIIRSTVCGASITDIAKNIKASTSTVWSCRLKVYQTVMNIYGYCDTFNNIVEVDGKYERISFKGCKDSNFFIDKLGRLPRHHRSRRERFKYIEQCGKFKELFKTKPDTLKEMVFSSQKRMTGRSTIDLNHQHVCVLTAIDRTGSIYIEPVTAGTAKATDVYSKLVCKIERDAVLVTDDHHSYKYYAKSEKITHIKIAGGTYTKGAYSLSRVNSLHSSIDRFFGCKEFKPATKYLDLYLMMFWWLQKNKELSINDLYNKLFAIMTGHVSCEARAKMTRVTIGSLVSRELPIDTKGFYPKCA